MLKIYSLLAASAVTVGALASTPATIELLQQKADARNEYGVTIPRNVVAVDAPQRAVANPPANSGQWTEWETYGSGTYSINGLYGTCDAINNFPANGTITVTKRNDTGNANTIQFKLSGLFTGHDIIVDCDGTTNQLWVKPQSTGLTDDNGVELLFSDAASVFVVYGPGLGYDDDNIQMMVDMYGIYNYWIPAMGRLYIYLGFFPVVNGTDMSGIGDMLIELEGFTDYTPQVSAPLHITADNNPGATITKAEGVNDVRYAVYPGILNQGMLDTFLKGGEEVKALPADGHIDLPLTPANEISTILAVSYENGEAMEMGSAFYTPVDAQAGQWTSLGQCAFVTDIWESLFEAQPSSYSVVVEENNATPGLYRVVNPFGANYPFAAGKTVDTDFDHYLTIDATNPDRVIARPMEVGLDLGAGVMTIESIASYYLAMGNTATWVANKGYYGKLTDGVITFPKDGILLRADDWSQVGGDKGSVYSGNFNGDTKLTLNNAGISDVAADSNANLPVVYYNLQGIRVANPAEGQVVVRVQGTEATKVHF